MPHHDVVKLVISGAAGQIGYQLVPMAARGLMFGAHRKVELRLLDIEPAFKVLEALKMEIEDSAYHLVTDTLLFINAEEAFAGATAVVLCGAIPRKPGMERKDLLEANAKTFREQGVALKKADKDCRVLVVGNPANTNALILAAAAAPEIAGKNITALTRLDHNRALAQVALRASGSVADVKNVIIWGNHSNTQVPDINSATIGDVPVRDAVADTFWDNEFMSVVQKRGAEVMNKRGLSSATSAAKAICDHMHDWTVGTHTGHFVSMAILTTEEQHPYGAPPGVFFSFPCTCHNGEWKIVDGIVVTEQIAKHIAVTSEELLQERSLAGVA